MFLADRNILANQAFNDFGSFGEDAIVRITPEDIRKRGGVPKNASVFFTIFHTLMCGPKTECRRRQMKKTKVRQLKRQTTRITSNTQQDFFDLIIIDECHRGGANDESAWRDILNYFAPAVQLGLTATPKRTDNADTYGYFGEPVYSYTLKRRY